MHDLDDPTQMDEKSRRKESGGRNRKLSPSQTHISNPILLIMGIVDWHYRSNRCRGVGRVYIREQQVGFEQTPPFMLKSHKLMQAWFLVAGQ